MVVIKPSSYSEMLQRLGLIEEQSVYAGIGHAGEQDSIVNIIRGWRRAASRTAT